MDFYRESRESCKNTFGIDEGNKIDCNKMFTLTLVGNILFQVFYGYLKVVKIFQNRNIDAFLNVLLLGAVPLVRQELLIKPK